MKTNKSCCWQVFALFLGSSLLIGGVVLLEIFPILRYSKVVEKMQLYNGSFFYPLWVEKPIPFHLKVYLFNVTNPQDVLLNSSKPILQELGPYTFKVKRKKIDIRFNDDEDTVRYKERTNYYFRPSLSNGSLMDNVTTLNIPLTSLAMLTEGKLSIVEQMLLPQMITNYKATPFVTKTVHELTFKGYQDKLIKYLQEQTGKELLPNGTFGFFYDRNVSKEVSIFAGNKYPEKFLQLHKWNNLSSLSWWDSNYCNMINGTDGTAFRPFLTQYEPLQLFQADFCRSFHMEYEDMKYINGIKAYSYSFPTSVMASPDNFPENKCYCNKSKTCLKSGVFDISACQQNTPIVLSFPHFYQGDDTYYHGVIGLNRSEKLHKIIFDIDTLTGVPIRGHKRIQLNIAVRPVSHIPLFKNFTKMLFPILWMDEHGEWTPEAVQDYKATFIKPQKLYHILCYLLISIGSGILLFLLYRVGKDLLTKLKKGSPSYPNVTEKTKLVSSDDRMEK